MPLIKGEEVVLVSIVRTLMPSGLIWNAVSYGGALRPPTRSRT